MIKKDFKYIYGPLYSWRLGESLGIDPVCQIGKACTFDCTYCQIGKTKFLSAKRKVYVPTKAIIKELSSLPRSMKIDYITLSGNGEPTLAKNLGDIIKNIRRIRKERIAVITNSSLIARRDVQADLILADFVLLKLDANAEDLFMNLNRPVSGIRFGDIIKGIKKFKEIYRGRLALQVMFTEKNKTYAKEIARTAKKLGIKEVQINTPLRKSQDKPLSKPDMDVIKKYFSGMKIVYVYSARKKEVKSMDIKETEKRHGKYR